VRCAGVDVCTKTQASARVEEGYAKKRRASRKRRIKKRRWKKTVGLQQLDIQLPLRRARRRAEHGREGLLNRLGQARRPRELLRQAPRKLLRLFRIRVLHHHHARNNVPEARAEVALGVLCGPLDPLAVRGRDRAFEHLQVLAELLDPHPLCIRGGPRLPRLGHVRVQVSAVLFI
jgi:hypothetical protein